MSKISTLTERLQSQIQQEQQVLESQTSDVLTKHGEALKKLSSDALTTTRGAIKSESELLVRSVASIRMQAEAHIQKVPRMLLLSVLWPVLASFMLCALVVVGTWLFLPTALFSARTETWKLENGQTATVITSPGWTICTDKSKRQLPCYVTY